uniref:Autophagy-related protein 13 N-terminal domain-containing protein n=1 Tax=Auxenochlorella protothecoides TaxID=3075 RepID=A0A1D1ZWK9_AUXPR
MSGDTGLVETLLERWVFHHQQLLPDSPSSLSKSALVRLSPSSIYKRLVILLRSVFALLRTLPAHKLCRAGGAGRRSAFSLGYRLHSSLPGGAGEGGPERSGSGGGGSAGGSSSGPAGPGAAQARAPRGLARFAFAPAETPYGRIRVSVDYRPASAVTVLEQTSSGAAPRLIIQDYVGGGGAAGALRGRAGPAGASAPRAVDRAEDRGAAGPRHAPLLPRPSAPAAMPGLEAGAGGSPRVDPGPGLARAATAAVGVGPARGAGPAAHRPGAAPAPSLRRSSWSTGAARLSPSRLGAVAARTPGHAGEAPGSAASPAPGTPPSPWAHAAGGSAPGTSARRHPLARPPRAAAPGTSLDRPQPAWHGSAPQTPPHHGSHDGAGRTQVTWAPSPARGEGGESAGSPRHEANEGAWDRGPGSPDAPRPSASRPVSIPGSAAHSALRSLDDLRAAGGGGGSAARASGAPSSAPARARHVAPPSPPRAEASEAEASDPGAPMAFMTRIAGPSDSGSSAASSGAFPTSCSPTLPFALTPSGQSLGSATGSLPRGGAGAAPARPGSLGATGAGALGLLRRPSWSSSSFRGSGGLGSMGPPTVGYSVSPMQDVTLEALLSASTPRHSSHLSGLRTLPAVLVESSSTALVHVAGGGRLPSAGGPSSATHVEARSTPRDVLEDLLPFALDGEASSVEQAAGEGEVQAGDVGDGGLDGGRATPQPGEQHGGGGGGVGGHPGLGALAAVDGRIILCVPSATQGAVPSSMSTQSAGAPGTTALALPSPFASGAPQAGHPTSAPPSQDSDAAVGAFVRLLRDAPPLQACGRGGVGAAAGSGGPHRRLTVAAGLARLQSLQDRLARQAEGSLVA